MPGLDVTVNVISLFAFILVLGIVVDDAIIVGENVYAHQEEHGEGMRGAIEGSREIATPVVFAVLTTVAAFTPLLFVPGLMGKIFRVIPLVVIPCLLFSLVESLWILPAHLSHIPKRRRNGPLRRFQQFVANGLKRFIQRVYRPALELCLQWRYTTAAIGVSTLIVTGGMVLGGWTNFHFFPAIEADFMAASLTMPQGTPVSETAAAVRKLELGAERVRRDLLEETGRDYFRHTFAAIGDQPMAAREGGPMAGMISASAAHLGEVTVELLPSQDRALSSEQIVNRWREATGSIPEAVEVGFNASIMAPGDDVDVMLVGSDMDRLRAAADDVKTRLAGYAGVYDITDSFRAGKREIEAGHQAGGRNARPDARGSRQAGAPGVLRRGSAADSARPRRHPRHGALPGRPAPVGRGPREHADPRPGRRRSTVRTGRNRRTGTRVRVDQAGRPQPRRQRDRVRGRDRHHRRGGGGRPADARPARNPAALSGRVLCVRRGAGGAGGSGRRTAGRIRHRGCWRSSRCSPCRSSPTSSP